MRWENKLADKRSLTPESGDRSHGRKEEGAKRFWERLTMLEKTSIVCLFLEIKRRLLNFES